jgi:hypothetical protein
MFTNVRFATLATVLALPVLAVPVSAIAQPAGTPLRPVPDLEYCARLSELYIRYIGRGEAGPHAPVQPDVNGGVALAQCREGNAGPAIPVLEQKLINGGFTLPPRT